MATESIARRTSRSRRAILPALALAALGPLGCVRPATTVVGAGTGGGGVVVESARLGWGTKEVVQKRAPEALLARDGTICRVSPDRFRETAVGELVRCNWQ